MVHSALPGGSNEMLLTLLRHRPQGARCDVVFLQDGPIAERAAALGARVAVVDAGRAREAWRARRVVRAIRGAIRRSGPQLVVSHVSKAHLYAAPAAWLDGLPIVWRQPELRDHKPGMIELAARLPATAVVCSSDATAADHRSRWPWADVRRVHPGVEVDGLGAPREHEPGPVVLGVVGRLQRWKRVELALRALPELLRALPDARLRVVGGAAPGLDEGYEEELREEAARLGVAAAVEWAGQMPGADAAMARLDVLVHTADREPFGLVLVEALLRGVPVVAPAAGGPAEIVRDGVDGLLVDVEDPEALAAGLVAVAADPERRAAMAAAGRRHALERFTAQRAAAELWALFAAAAKRRA